MSEGNVRHTNQHRAKRIKVYYDGTETLARGYVLCFDQDATENGTDPADRLGFTVEKPATANLMYFAGIYTGDEGAITDPGYITIEVPQRGSMAEAWCDATATSIGTNALAPQDGEWGFGLHSDATINLAMVALAAVSVDTDTTNALSTVMWL